MSYIKHQLKAPPFCEIRFATSDTFVKYPTKNRRRRCLHTAYLMRAANLCNNNVKYSKKQQKINNLCNNNVKYSKKQQKQKIKHESRRSRILLLPNLLTTIINSGAMVE